MSTANTSAVNYTVPPNVNGSGAVNGGGVSTRVNSTSLLRSVAVSKDTTGVFASTVVDGADTDPAVSGGVFAYNHDKPITARVTTKLAGLNSSVLSNTSNDPAQLRSINKRETIKSNGVATAIRAGYWNLYTGEWSTNPTPVTVNLTGTPTTNQAQAGTDVAANPSRSAPGDLVFRTGAKLPVRNYDYKAKNG